MLKSILHLEFHDHVALFTTSLRVAEGLWFKFRSSPPQKKHAIYLLNTNSQAYILYGVTQTVLK